tara:strand:- start:468 stop:1556 length:1089 start_codon:yes stop_codon:yes gene_type:complete
MSESSKTRGKGTELKDIDIKNYKNAFDAMGWLHKSSPVSRLIINYVPDRSKKRLIQNMGWMKAFITHITENLNTRSSRMSRLQHWLIKLYPSNLKDLIKSTMTLTRAEYTAKNDISNAARDEQSKNVFTITKADLLKIVDTLKADNSIIANMFLIQMSVGRRKGEILTVSDIPEKKGKSVIFTRLSKTKADGLFKVPLYHLNFKDLIARWKTLRRGISNDIKGKSDIEIGKLYQREINETLAKIGLETHGSHIFRKLYVAWSLQFKPKRWTDGVYIKKILAHNKNGGASALHYSNVVLGDSTDMIKAAKPRVVANNDIRANLKQTIIKMIKDGDKITSRTIKARGYGSSTYTKYFHDIMSEI